MKNTKQYIIKTAFSLFIQKSYRDVTMNEIVKKTGLSKGAVYHYFKSKEELFRESVEKFFLENFLLEFKKLSHNSLREFLEGYRAMAMRFLETMNTEITDMSLNGINFYMLMFEAVGHLPGFRKRVIELNNFEKNRWIEIIKIARKKKEIKSVLNDEQLASVFIFIGDGIGMRAVLEGKINGMYKKIYEYWDTLYEELKYK
jgi:AcrR family transcriptional regulator